jgi:hypothetical protein
VLLRKRNLVATPAAAVSSILRKAVNPTAVLAVNVGGMRLRAYENSQE